MDVARLRIGSESRTVGGTQIVPTQVAGSVRVEGSTGMHAALVGWCGAEHGTSSPAASQAALNTSPPAYLLWPRHAKADTDGRVCPGVQLLNVPGN